MNIIVVMSDTLRYDHLGCHGNPWIRTPHIDAFSKRCMLFDRAYQASFPTIPTRTDMMTGRLTFPFRGWTPLPEDEVILAELLTDAGYVTMLLCDTPHLVRDGHRFDRGFLGWEWIRRARGRPLNHRRRTRPPGISPRKNSHGRAHATASLSLAYSTLGNRTRHLCRPHHATRRRLAGSKPHPRKNSSCTSTPSTLTNRGTPPRTTSICTTPDTQVKSLTTPFTTTAIT